MLQSFKEMKSKRVALLLFVIIFPIMFACRIPYFVEGDTTFYASKMQLFIDGWDVFLADVMSKHVLYVMALGILRMATPFLRSTDTVTLFSTLFSSLNIALTYYVSEKWFKDRKAALVAVGGLLSIRYFLYFTLLGEQYTFQAFFMLVIILLILERKYVWGGVALGIAMMASPSCGYLTPAYLYLIWSKEKNLFILPKFVIPPTIIFGPVLLFLRKEYAGSIGFTMNVFFSHTVITGLKITASCVLDNFLFLLPLLAMGYFVVIRKYRTYGIFFTIAFACVSFMVIGVATPKWYTTMLPLFTICIGLLFRERVNLRVPIIILMVLNVVVFSSMFLIPLYRESISQHDIFMTPFPKPIIMRWSSGVIYQYYTQGPPLAYLEIMSIESNRFELGYRYSLYRLFELHDKVYLYDYLEVQCRPNSSVYGCLSIALFPRNETGCIGRILKIYPEINYTIYREFKDGTIIWELTAP